MPKPDDKKVTEKKLIEKFRCQKCGYPGRDHRDIYMHHKRKHEQDK